jgi:hypothetical protein
MLRKKEQLHTPRLGIKELMHRPRSATQRRCIIWRDNSVTLVRKRKCWK